MGKLLPVTLARGMLIMFDWSRCSTHRLMAHHSL